ncbi:MAG TPA: hypothetical protein VG986_15160 [Pseudolabrys sp.]|nr:hypothetical protein [Pseudolabrys sp.]
MRLKIAAAAIALVGAVALLAQPADAAPKKKRVAVSHGQTVFVSRDENGRARTRIIVQRRSYLDPGTETFPGERSDHSYAWLPNHTASSVMDNTTFIRPTALPGPWTLPSRDNPWIGY